MQGILVVWGHGPKHKRMMGLHPQTSIHAGRQADGSAPTDLQTHPLALGSVPPDYQYTLHVISS